MTTSAQVPAKVLGIGDVLIFCLGTGIGLRWLPVAAAAGQSALTLWAISLVAFYLPLVLVVTELTSRYEGEGEIFLWTREGLGPFSAFICGWCYWTAILPYLAGLAIFTIGVLAFLAAVPAETIDPASMFLMCAGIMSAVVVLNIIGLARSKWLTNVGGLSVWLLLAFILAAGATLLISGQSATRFTTTGWLPPITASTLVLWAVITFAFSGTEAIGFMRTEAKGGYATIARGLLLAGVLISVGYVAGTVAIMAILPATEIGALSGLPEALTRALTRANWGVLAPAAILLLAFGTVGGLNAWFGAAARLPFAAGIDSFLPESFGRRHARFDSPYVALLVQAGLVVLVLALSQIGSSSSGTYAFLIRTGILGGVVPYVFLFVAYIRIQSQPQTAGGWRIPGGPLVRRLVGVIGLVTTLTAIAATLMPDPAEGDRLAAFIKVVTAGGILIGTGVVFYAMADWRRRRALAV